MAKHKRCIACQKPFEPKRPTDELCPPHAKQFEQIYGKGDETMGSKKKDEKGEVPGPKATAGATGETVELFAGVDDEGEGDGKPTAAEPGGAPGGSAETGTGAGQADAPPASEKKDPSWARRPKVAAKRLRFALKTLSRFDWPHLGADGVQGALAILTNAAAKLEARQAAAPKKVEPGVVVRVREAHVKSYTDLFGADELVGLKVEVIAGKQARVVSVLGGFKLAFPVAHLEPMP